MTEGETRTLSSCSDAAGLVCCSNVVWFGLQNILKNSFLREYVGGKKAPGARTQLEKVSRHIQDGTFY